MKTQQNILEQLHPEELEFFKAICKRPGCKYPMDNVFYDIEDGSEHGRTIAKWDKLEELKLVECVGGYKWKPLVSYEDLLLKEIESLKNTLPVIKIELFQGEPIEAVAISSDPLHEYQFVVQLPKINEEDETRIVEIYHSNIKHIS